MQNGNFFYTMAVPDWQFAPTDPKNRSPGLFCLGPTRFLYIKFGQHLCGSQPFFFPGSVVTGKSSKPYHKPFCAGFIYTFHDFPE